MLDYYEILGLSRDADQESIKKSYREAAFKFHPDRNPGDASCEERFKKISEAYSILSDEEKKLQYDMRLNNPGLDSAAYQNPFGGYNSPWPPTGGPNAEWKESPFTFYTYTWRNTEDPNPPRNAWTRKTAMEQLLRNMATALLGIFLFRYSLLFGILGFIVCLSIIGRGLIGSFQAVRYLFSSK